MELFEYANPTSPQAPLAEKLRPQDITQIFGQDEILKKGTWLFETLKNDTLPSLILWGPPGCGKTTFAKIVAHNTKKEFVLLNAISTGAKELRELSEKAKLNLKMYNKGTVIFIDEIHRLNKSQQDVLLPFVESGDITLVGATTENPSFEVNSALLSRTRVVVFKKHSLESLEKILEKAFQFYNLKPDRLLDNESKSYLIGISDGDARRLLNRVEELVLYYQQNQHNQETTDTDFPLNVDKLKGISGSLSVYHDQKGESHYDTISVFIKSIRGSDPDAALYYLARMLEGGEDPKFVARRLVILASEDVGNADPQALHVAINGFRAVEIIGLPECAINLAQVVVYLSSCPKSNSSYMGLREAQAEVRKTGLLPIPLSVRNAPTQLMKDLGYAGGYNYAHEGDKGWVPQQFLPDEIKNKKFYHSKSLGFEKRMNEYLSWLKKEIDKSGT